MTVPPETPADDWADLTQAWAETPGDEPRLDADLIRSLRRSDRLARLNFAAEIGGAIVVAGVMGWALWRGMPLPVAGGALAFVLFSIGMTLWSRRGDPGLMTETPQAVLRSAVGQARIGYRWAVAGIAISLAAMVFMTLMLTLAGLSKPYNGLILGVGGVSLVVCIGFYLRHARRCRRRMAAHQAALDALAALSDAPHPIETGAPPD